MRPPSSTRISSAAWMVERRCAITIDVRPSRAPFNACWMWASFSESRWDVASSRLGRGRDARQDPLRRAFFEIACALGFERGERDVGRRRVAEPDVVDLDAAARIVEGEGAGRLGDGGRRVEHVEDRLEAD